LEIFLERAQGVAIARGGGVLRNLERAPNFGESKFVPDFHDDNFSLFVWQKVDGGSQRSLRFVFDGKLWLA
jgi:hypothetical protein